jgi:hypothetical protein
MRDMVLGIELRGVAVDLPRSHQRGIIVARLRSPAFGFVTGHIRKGAILLTSRTRFWDIFTNMPLNKVATTIALPPDLFFHGSLLMSLRGKLSGVLEQPD